MALPGILIGLALLAVAFKMGDERGGMLNEVLQRILKLAFITSCLVAAAVFFICGGLMILMLPFAGAAGALGELSFGLLGQMVFMSGLLLAVLKIDF